MLSSKRLHLRHILCWCMRVWVETTKWSMHLKVHRILYVDWRNIPMFNLWPVYLWTVELQQWYSQKSIRTRRVLMCIRCQQFDVSRCRYRWIHKRRLQRSREWRLEKLQCVQPEPYRLRALRGHILQPRPFRLRCCRSLLIYNRWNVFLWNHKGHWVFHYSYHFQVLLRSRNYE